MIYEVFQPKPDSMLRVEKEYLDAANDGDLYSQSRLADTYYFYGYHKDALYWYNKLAEVGWADALVKIGDIYISDTAEHRANIFQFVIPNPEKAISLFEKAFEYGNPDAALRLCIHYSKGGYTYTNAEKSKFYCKFDGSEEYFKQKLFGAGTL